MILQFIIGHRDRGGIERIGLDDIGAGFEVLQIDRRDQVRLGNAQDVVATPQVARMSGELGAAKRLLVELVALDHRAHGAVENSSPVN